MKQRNSFVSNSSSSSYVIVGIDSRNPLHSQIVRAAVTTDFDDKDNWDAWHDWTADKSYDYGIVWLDNKLVAAHGEDIVEFYDIGVPAFSRLKDNMRLSEIAEELRVHLKEKYNIESRSSDFTILSGECGSG